MVEGIMVLVCGCVPTLYHLLSGLYGLLYGTMPIRVPDMPLLAL